MKHSCAVVCWIGLAGWCSRDRQTCWEDRDLQKWKQKPHFWNIWVKLVSSERMAVGMMFGILGDSPGGCLIAPNQHWIWNLFIICNRKSGRYPRLWYAGTTAKGRVHHNCTYLFCIVLPLDHGVKCLMLLCLIFKLFRNRLTCQPAWSGLCTSSAASGYWKKDKY